MASDKDYRALDLFVRQSYSALMRKLELMESTMASVVEDLKAEVAKNIEVTTSAVKLIELLSAKIQSGLDNRDFEEIQKVVDDIRSDSKILGDAVAANTPSASEIQPSPSPVSGETPPIAVPEAPAEAQAPEPAPEVPPSPPPEPEPQP